MLLILIMYYVMLIIVSGVTYPLYQSAGKIKLSLLLVDI